MSYKTDKPRDVEAQIAEDGVEDEVHKANLGAEVICLQCERAQYTRVYLIGPRKSIVSVTIDDSDKGTRMIETARVTNKFRVAGAKVKLNFG